MIKDRCDILSDVMDIEINDKTLEEALLVSSILSPQEYIYHIKENMYDAEFSFMNGDCGALAISLDLLYGDEDSSFAVIHTSRGDEDDEEPADEQDSDQDYLWRLSLFGEMKHILWKDKEGQYFDILGKHKSIPESIEKSENFYEDYNMPSLDVDASEFSSKKVSKYDLYEKILKGTRMSLDSPLEIIEVVSKAIQENPKIKNRIKI